MACPDSTASSPRSQIETTCHLSDASCRCARNLQRSALVCTSTSEVHSVQFDPSCSINTSIWFKMNIGKLYSKKTGLAKSISIIINLYSRTLHQSIRICVFLFVLPWPWWTPAKSRAAGARLVMTPLFGKPGISGKPWSNHGFYGKDLGFDHWP